jgi:hypothetical protein
MANAVREFLAGRGKGAGRALSDVLAMDDAALERTHDWVQWLFPLPERSACVPWAPVVDADGFAEIRADAAAVAGFRRGLERALRFLADDRSWLRFEDHNHKRVTRIISSVRLVLGDDEARRVQAAFLEMDAAAGHPCSPVSVGYWRAAVPATRLGALMEAVLGRPGGEG